MRPGEPPTLVNGYAPNFRNRNFEGGDSALNPENFVSRYARSSAAEDFAESYRAYLKRPAELMNASPEKFLFINAKSRKYPPDEIRSIAVEAGVDLPLAMASLRGAGLRDHTLDLIEKRNGLEKAGAAGTAAGDVLESLPAHAGDPGFAARLMADPEDALGAETWDRLTARERQLLQDPEYTGKLLAAAAANKAAPADKVTAGDVKGWRAYLKDLLREGPEGDHSAGDLLRKLHKPEYWDQLSPRMRDLFDSKAGKDFFKAMANDKNFVDITNLAWKERQGHDVRAVHRWKNVDAYLDRLGPADVEELARMIDRGLTNREAKLMSRANAQLATTGEFPRADGNPPGM
ncbi:MAG: hypothetical protein FJZ01_01040 [Candidatus Sericytochromatia bacterium]|nr:hypothetical protein [Candidatus Tanganyikabacteria bacterium]